ncbi:MAG: hypothetical protein C0620_04125 [Desulfuromonas sp.]|nr:MAG: hypothetical protein C0620_04125 [Desulfuromonas sp.]
MEVMSISHNNITQAKSDKAVSTAVFFAVVIICFSYLFLASRDDLRLFIPEFLLVSGSIVAILAGLLVVPATSTPQWVGWWILLTGACFRVLFVSAAPQLSDDVYRYLWDGLNVLHGVNPYAQAPQQAVADSARMAILQNQINHPALVTLYPPVAELFFALAAGHLIAYKLLLIMIDLGSCFILWRLLQRLGRPLWWLAFYAWHPLVIVECAASAHIDILAVFLVLVSLWTAVSGRRWAGLWSGVALSMAVLVKVFPVIFVPFCLLMVPGEQRRTFFLAGMTTMVFFTLPFCPQILHGLETLGTYSRHWEFSGFTFQQLRTFVQSGDVARLILASTFAVVLLVGWLRLCQHRQRSLAVLVSLLSAQLLFFLLLTPTLHPWYALYLVAFTALVPRAAAIVMSWAVLLSYQVVAKYFLTGIWQEDPWTAGYIWLAPLLALLATSVLRRRRLNS